MESGAGFERSPSTFRSRDIVLKNDAQRFRLVLAPETMRARVAIHSMATVTGVVFAVRMGWGGPLWTGVAWYFGSFIGFHVVLMPFMAAWFMVSNRIERWVRGIVEEELIKFDMKAYEGQLRRALPIFGKRPGDE